MYVTNELLYQLMINMSGCYSEENIYVVKYIPVLVSQFSVSVIAIQSKMNEDSH